MSTWMKEHFSDAEQAKTTICVTALVGGFIGLALFVIGAIASR